MEKNRKHTGILCEFRQKQSGVSGLPGHAKHLHSLERVTLLQELTSMADQQGLHLGKIVLLGEVHSSGNAGWKVRKNSRSGIKGTTTRAALTVDEINRLQLTFFLGLGELQETGKECATRPWNF